MPMITGEPLGSSRVLSLRAPIANEEERAHFQRRMALISGLLFVLASTFWVITLVSVAITAPQQVHHLWTSRPAQLQLATTFFGLASWAYARPGRRSAAALDVLDVASALLLCSGWAAMTFFEGAPKRADLIGLLACTYTLVTRAALVPSTPARTAILGIAGLAPLVIVTHLRGGFSEPSPHSLLSPAMYVAIWAVIGTAATTMTTWVIYGLRLQVRNALQLGQYFLEEKIGEGGMGAVYRASHAMLRRPTAIKLMSPTTKKSAIDRFEREVQITARLAHPNTIAVFDYGRTPEGLFYYAMEYLEGLSLEQLVAASGPQPPARVVHVLLQVCGALREAHAEGLVHRDIKPANIMLTSRGWLRDFVKVVDFGLVKEIVTPESAAVTNADVILGTPYYMAPESIVDPASVDGRADLYALGATAFFLLTGEHLFSGSSVVEVCSKHLEQKPAAPSAVRPGIPESLDAIVLACVAKKRDDRPKDAATLAEMLSKADVPTWTNADATAWWEEHRDVIPKSAPAALSELSETVAVVMDGRGQRAAAEEAPSLLRKRLPSARSHTRRDRSP